MKWYCPTCSPRRRADRPRACKACCGFRAEVAIEGYEDRAERAAFDAARERS